MNDPAASGQCDAGPKWQHLSRPTKVLRGSRAKRTPLGHEGNGKDITSVSPASPPRVAGRGIKPTGGNDSLLEYHPFKGYLIGAIL